MKKHSNVSETFGSYIRRLRIKNDIGQRELAKKIGVAPSYLNDMEKSKRTAPRINLIKKLSVILKADLDLLNDLAGNSKKTIAPDIVDFIENNPKVVSLLRAAKNSKLNEGEIGNIEKKINESKTKVLIVAARNKIVSCEYAYHESMFYCTNQIFYNRGGGDREAKPRPYFL